MNIQLPKSWRDVTIDQFQKCYAADRALPEQPTDIEYLEHRARIVSILSGVDYDTIINTVPVQELSNLYRSINILPEKANVTPSFIIDGKKYLVSLRVEELIAGQKIDLVNFSSNEGKMTQDAMIQNMHQFLAVVCLPAVKVKGGWFKKKFVASDYVGKDVPARADMFKEKMTLGIAYPIASFFLQVWESFLADMPQLIEKEMNDLLKTLEEGTGSIAIGDGS